MKTVKVAIVGFGTIGSGVARLLLEHADRISRQAGCCVELARVVDKDLHRPRNVVLSPGLLTDDVGAVLSDPEIGTVVQLIGGLEPERTIMLKMLEAGKNIVTANKALLAEHGAELFDRARALGRTIAFEAAVAGGIPIIASINECLTANQIQSIHAIVNGTSNFILTQMEEAGTDYAAAVAEAQRLGYAEANPEMDVNGADAAQKLAILAHLAFGARINWRDIPRIGIDTVALADIRFAQELGYRIKLLAVAELTDEGLELHVSPTLVRHGTPLAEVREAFNAVRVIGDAVGRVFYQGQGAGQMPTASAVVADLISTLVGRTEITFRSRAFWSESAPAAVAARDSSRIIGRHYMRFNVDDRPGVMAEIAGILGSHQISIASIIQHESEDRDDGVVPLIIMTHASSEGAVADAFAAINKLACAHPGGTRMRVRA
ncbi:MAG: homoserine dehydrogenase [Planctomycetota bacterium]